MWIRPTFWNQFTRIEDSSRYTFQQFENTLKKRSTNGTPSKVIHFLKQMQKKFKKASSSVKGACACCTVPPHVHCIESFASSCLLLLSVPPTGKYVYFSTFVYFYFPKGICRYYCKLFGIVLIYLCMRITEWISHGRFLWNCVEIQLKILAIHVQLTRIYLTVSCVFRNNKL